AGNAVVYKPAQDTPWTGLELHEVYRDAGLPPGVCNYLTGRGAVIGDALWQHPGVDGVVFTGSHAVGMHIYRGLSQRWVKPCLLEMGGKNACLVTDSADLDAAAEGVMRSAFSLQNQKCSATSRVYVYRAVARPFLERLIERTRAMTTGDPAARDVFFGPVINAGAVQKFERAVAQARREGTILLGGQRLTGGAFDRGHFVAPTIAVLPLTSSLFLEELFVPLLAVGEVAGLDEAIAEANKAEYGLTAGSFSKKPEEIERFFDEIEAGVCQADKRTRAPTGAWPGGPPFTGWKGAGSAGHGGDRGRLDRIWSPQGREGDPGRRWALSAHLRRRLLLRGLRGAHRAAGQARSGGEQEARFPLELGCRGGRGRDQAGAPLHRAPRAHRLQRCLPRPHLRRHD